MYVQCPVKICWKFYKEISNPSLYGGIKALISSGIYYRVLVYFERQKFSERNNDEKTSRTKFSSSVDPNLLRLPERIVKLLILFVLSLLVTALVFLSQRKKRMMSRCLVSTFLMTNGMNNLSVLGLYKTLTELFLLEAKILKRLYQLSKQLYPKSKLSP